ncbi:MAG: hypothetical protein WC686_03590 [Candidatus Shapirobacteria bacterium]|jgi:hypothetical protein
MSYQKVESFIGVVKRIAGDTSDSVPGRMARLVLVEPSIAEGVRRGGLTRAEATRIKTFSRVAFQLLKESA